jgi:hypothetical protein
MKSARLFLITVLAFGLFHIMTAQQRGFDDYETRRNNKRDHIKKLTNAGLYDSALSYCAVLRKNDSLSYDDLEKAQATIYWLKGDKNTAYQYVLNATDYLLKTYAGERAFTSMLYDYDYAYPIATDSFLENMIINKVSDFYSGLHDFPQCSSALKFMLLEYRANKLLASGMYALKQNPDHTAAKKLDADFTEQEEQLKKEYLEEIKQNGKILGWKEAGPGYKTQITFLSLAGDSALHLQTQPYFEQAFKHNDFESYLYVDQLVWIAALKEKDSARLEQYHDSLCHVYNCHSVRRAYPQKSGDSIIIRSGYTFDLPK